MAERFFPLNARFRLGLVNGRGEVVPSPEFLREYDILWKRVGEYEALTNTELEALTRAEKLGVFGNRQEQRLTVKKGTGPLTVTQDITGFTVSIDMDQIIGAVRSFMPRQEVVKPPRPNDANWVIANRIFGA